MPAVSVPPQLNDVKIKIMGVKINATIDHMLGALSIKRIPRRIALGKWGAGCGG
jgi:hypothetical protein